MKSLLQNRLREELARWSDTGRVAEFWWRDDDVQAPTGALTKLLAISQRHHAPLSLAAVPDGLKLSLPESLAPYPTVNVLQHGFSHNNYAPADERKMELGWHRPEQVIRQQLHSGVLALKGLFAESFVPMLVPPWNRIDDQVVALLPELGLMGLSTLGPRPARQVVAGLTQLNVHVDIINWREGRCFAGEAACVEQILAHLQAKRSGDADSDEATGIMSHHLVHDQRCWEFLDVLFAFLVDSPDAKLVSARDAITAATA